ncbi:lipocalin-like domain-containing protein [Vibrio algivorus]|uniref:Carotenoid 1,2-hydratase n=1 Tax=Vibrio algivorus TaxID=1667024 RepID=A0A557PEK8_9VIBR|nr:lipocalin-like domain-containing protein [Vibrio algivorus]TVO39098.1 carotenoid 1,2-hydratase [Vibrio algivorus]
MKTKRYQWMFKVAVMTLAFLLLSGLLAPNFVKELVAKEIDHLHIQAESKEGNQAVYDPVLPDYTIKYGKDFAEHGGFHNEVWHYRANLKGDDGLDYGVQWTVYRVANGDHQGVGWENAQIYTAQVVVSTSKHSWSQQRIARGGIGQAGVMMYPFRLWIDDWSWVSNNNFAIASQLNVKTDDFQVTLQNAAYGPFVLNGDKGYEKTHDLMSTASYSFSAPFIKAKGSLILNGKAVKVSGIAWLDKEWGNHLVANRSLRWDTFNLHLSDGRVLSLTQYHNPQNIRYISGSLSSKNGSTIKIKDSEVRIYPIEKQQLLNGRLLPLRWVIELPNYQISLITQSLNKELWLPFWIPSWEGPIEVTGSHKGVGFMQLTGY